MNGTPDVFAIPLEDEAYLVYAPLHGVAFAATKGLVAALPGVLAGAGGSEGGEDSVAAFAREAGLLRTPPSPVTRRKGDPAPTEVTLFLTTACNLRCTYCYASAGDAPATYMSMEVAKQGIDFVIDNAKRLRAPYVGVNYHGGGEPSVHWNLMTESLAYAHERADGLDVIAASAGNGVFTDRQIDWMIANLNGGMSLSFDGLPEAHDKHRPTVRGTGSSDRVMHTMRRFTDADYPYAVRLTVTAEQIPLLPDSIEFILSRFTPQRVQVEPAYQLGRHEGKPDAETEDFIAAYREAQARAARFGHELVYSAARVGTLTNHFCGITQDNFCLTPSGNVSACFEAFSEDNEFADVFFYGSSGPNGYTFDMDALGRLRELGVEQRAFCDGCFAKWNCAGDCYHKSLSANGRGEFVGSQRCHITRELVKDQLLTRIAGSGGLLWRDGHDGEPCTLHGGRNE
ncbi:radical SAM protein [Streptomyces sp. 891-h]|uniref:radical SAM protein n=1 Tax=Streptomyces sp. 891-h TaxID=2720714 RepID=UPI001FA969A2|nr:radical SAM protein [Streptomyces sp. 891-h]UNZ18464.1 radical SAM protein [Streptomyces sp. 891-h]